MRTFYKALSLLKLPLHKQAILVSDVPKRVEQTFNQNFTEGIEHEWYTRSGMFIVNFKHGDLFRQIYFDTSGRVQRAYRKVGIDDIPQAIIDSLEKTVPGHAILEVFLDDTTSGDDAFYRIAYIKSKKHIESEYDSNGTILLKDQL